MAVWSSIQSSSTFLDTCCWEPQSRANCSSYVWLLTFLLVFQIDFYQLAQGCLLGKSVVCILFFKYLMLYMVHIFSKQGFAWQSGSRMCRFNVIQKGDVWKQKKIIGTNFSNTTLELQGILGKDMNWHVYQYLPKHGFYRAEVIRTINDEELMPTSLN